MTHEFKCLIVDDEASNLDAFLKVLGDDFDLLSASSGKEALALLEKEKSVAVVVSDQRMSEMTGIELLIEIKKRYPEIVRIVLTGYSDYQVSIDAINKGDVFRYLHKPIDIELTIEAIAEGIEKYRKAIEIKKSLADIKAEIKERFLQINESLGAGVAHYVNNGLVPAKTFLSLLKEKIKELQNGEYDPHYFQDFLKEALRSIEGIEGLTSSLLWAHNATVEEFVKTSVAEMIDTENAELKKILQKKNLKIEMEQGEKLPPLFVDKEKVREMFSLLLKYCAVASLEKGTIHVKAFQSVDPSAKNGVHFQISYPGKGYSKHDIPRLFDPFYKFDSQLNTEVKGLELTNCYITAVKHGSELKVETGVKETSFLVDLPTLDE